MGRYEIYYGSTIGTTANSVISWYVISDVIDIYIPVYQYHGTITSGESMTGGIYRQGKTESDAYLNLPGYNSPTENPAYIYASDTLNYYHVSNSEIFGNAPSSFNSWIPENYLYLKGYMSANTRVRGLGQVDRVETTPQYGMIYDFCLWLRDDDGNFYRTQTHFTLGDGANPISSSPPSVIEYPTASKLGKIHYNLESTYRISWMIMPSGEDYGSSPGDTAIYIPNTDNITKKIESFVINSNPYGENDQPGGGGTQTDWNTPIPSDGTPTFDITETGFASVFAPTAAQLKSLSEYLWSDLFSVDTLKKLLADPFQALISLHMLPIAVTRGSTKDVAIGNIGTGVSMSLLDAKTYKVDCGTLNIDAYFGSFFDYSPYTTYQIYLPYIGYQSFTPDDFVGGTCQLVYIIDAVTGACVAQLISSKAGGAVLYQFSGSMGYSIPLSASSYQNFVGSVLSAAGSIVGAVKGFKSASGKFAGLDKASAALSGGSSALSAVQASKPDVSRSGSVGGATGWLANQTPYIIRTRPNAIIAKNQQAYTGYPSYQARKLSSLSGFTQVSYINLSLNGATSSEYDEAEKLLKEGVLI